MTFKYRWAAKGDINAFFGLMLDNMTGLVILASILIGIFNMPSDIVLLKMIPGTALGIMLGDFAYSWMAFRLAKKEERQDVCAMPLGIDAVALFGLSLGVIGPAYLVTENAEKAWAVGMAVLIVMGGVKTITAFFGEAVRRNIPRSALLGSIGALAVTLIAFLPFIKIFADPIPGFVAFGVILMTFIARIKLPWEMPGALAAVVLGTVVYYISKMLGLSPENHITELSLAFAIPLPTMLFMDGLSMGLQYLPLAIPIAISNVIGGIDNTESAAVAGDSYPTRDILLVEGVATLIAGFCGGVIQNSPYIGHPAYKRMGGRAAYTIACGLFIGLGAIFGLVGFLISILPESVMVPILVFIGLEVISQAYRETDARYFPAVSICFIPAIAYLLYIQFGQIMGPAGLTVSDLTKDFQVTYNSTMLLSNGFICTAIVWGAMTTHLIDQNLKKAASFCVIAAFGTAVGLMHSPFSDGHLFLPSFTLPASVYTITAGYLLMALSYFIMSGFNEKAGKTA